MMGAVDGTAVERIERIGLLEYACTQCKDWGIDEQARVCPAQCEAAKKFQQIRAAYAQPTHWLRRCNGLPKAGFLTTRDEADWCASLPGAIGTLTTKLAWTVNDHGARREFTLIPLNAEQLATWHTDQGILPPCG